MYVCVWQSQCNVSAITKVRWRQCVSRIPWPLQLWTAACRPVTAGRPECQTQLDSTTQHNMHQSVYCPCCCCYFASLMTEQANKYASQHIWWLSQARINWKSFARKGIRHKNGGDGKDGALISLDEVAVHPDCWCVCLHYLHFAPENPEEGKMYLLALAYLCCPRQSPERAVKWLCMWLVSICCYCC